MLIWILFILLEVSRNYYLIEVKKTRPNYLQSFIIRGMAAIFHGVILDVQNWHEYLPIFIFQVSSFWLIFDLLLNKLRKKPLLYMGRNSGWIDMLSKIAYLGFKILAVIVLIIVVFKLY